MTHYAVSIPLLTDAPTANLFPTLAGAVAQLAASAHQQWLRYAQGEPLPNGQVITPRSGTYHRSIQLHQTGDYAWRIFSDLAYADAIETGMPARDLKRMLGSSLKVRLSKDGKRYLIIPFRWGTPGTVGFGRNVMPSAVHAFWQSPTITRSQVTGMGTRLSGTGAYDLKTHAPLQVPQAQYAWGTRLTRQHLQTMGIADPAARRMTGMVNFRHPEGKGGAAHSQYLTFRVMSEDSPGWQAPAQPGKYPAKTVADRIQPIAEKAFAAALEQDLRRLL